MEGEFNLLSKELEELFYESDKEFMNIRYNNFKKSINFKEFEDKVDFNKRLISELETTCKFKIPIEVEPVIFNYSSEWSYIYRLIFAIFIMCDDNGMPNISILGFKLKSIKSIDVLYLLYMYFYRSPYPKEMKYPELYPIEKIYKLKLCGKSLGNLRLMLHYGKWNNFDVENCFINQDLDYEMLVKTFNTSNYKELSWYFNDEEIEYIEKLYIKAKSLVEANEVNKAEESMNECTKTNNENYSTNLKIVRSEKKQYLIKAESPININFDKNIKLLDNHIDTSKLTKGMVVDNYRKMCELLGQKIKAGNSKNLQVKDWKRYFEFKREGHKYIIKDIYIEPKVKEDNRGGNHCIYINELKPLLLDTLLEDTNKGKLLVSIYELLGQLNIIGENYLKFIRNKKELGRLLGIDEELIKHFYHYTYLRLRNNLESALNSLQTDRLIEVEKIIVIVQNSPNSKREVSSLEEKQILDAEEKVLSIMHRKNIGEIIFLDLWNIFSSRVIEMLKPKLEIHAYYRAYKISALGDANVNKPLSKNTRQGYRQKFNDTFVKRYETLNEDKHQKRNTPDTKFLNELFGEIENGNINCGSSAFITNIKKLTNKLLKIKAEYI